MRYLSAFCISLWSLCALWLSLSFCQIAGGASLAIGSHGGPGAIDLTSPVYIDSGDFKLVEIAAGLWCDDVQRVGLPRPAIKNDSAQLASQAVIIGTIGHSALIDKLIADGKFDAKGVAGNWETFRIATVENPLPNVQSALVIAGSDRRGTAYGVFDLSDAIGVSPWYWWADVPTAKREGIFIGRNTTTEGPPSVKYRGIFINDEDWGLEPWAAKNFEPEVGNIGPKTYAKVFELLLRLRGNYLCPAMHPVSTEFGRIAANIKEADDWGIVMGASHTEAMNRNNVLWPTEGTGPWRYDTNRDNVLKYWEEWAKLRGPYEAVWTVGIRGVHDAGMQGPPDMPSRVKIVEQVFKDQRELIKKYVNPDVTKVPQAFWPYKEVLPIYQNGLKVPDDVTIMWAEDNFGYVRQLPTPGEQKRAGGSGIYYHISYLGGPRSYVWLNSTPPPLIWEEMSKAYDYGANRVWVLNVGDIKPGEIGLEFWLKLGWDITAYNRNTAQNYLLDFAVSHFSAMPHEIADVLARYYRLGFARRPEAMDVNSFSLTNFDEAVWRLKDYDTLLADAKAIGAKLPASDQDAYYELVLYPVTAAAMTNHAFIDAQAGKDPASDIAAVEAATDYYNNDIAGGKWKGMMTVRGTTHPTYMFKWPKAVAQLPAVEVAFNSDYVCVAAEHMKSYPNSGAQWQTIPGLGRQFDVMGVYPTTTPSFSDVAKAKADAPKLEYDFTVSHGGAAMATVYAIPTHRINPERSLRYAISIDGEEPTVVNLEQTAGDTNKVWSQNVIRNASVSVTNHTIGAAGKHTLHVYMMDPGVLLEKLVVSFGPPPESELGPPEKN